MEHNAIQFEALREVEGEVYVDLVEFHSGITTHHNWKLDAVSAQALREAIAQDPFRKGKATVWFGGLSHTPGHADYMSRFLLLHGRSRKNFFRPCSKEFYDKLRALTNGWLPPVKIANAAAAEKMVAIHNKRLWQK